MGAKQACRHGVVLPRGLKCQAGYLVIRLKTGSVKTNKGCGRHTTANEYMARLRLADIRYSQVANLPLICKEVLTIKQTYNRRLRNQMFAALGQKCRCCAETESVFLTLDHIHKNGMEERQLVGDSSTEVLRHAFKRGFPKAEYQVLCFNCNCGRAKNGGVCPHQLGRKAHFVKLSEVA